MRLHDTNPDRSTDLESTLTSTRRVFQRGLPRRVGVLTLLRVGFRHDMKRGRTPKGETILRRMHAGPPNGAGIRLPR